ncbi:MAG: hypothetical protein JWL77_2162 [Chthonomonadaceae bacterium]|nr:hypothetical protein [Chthonomonadaceae bacterium]
MTVGKELPGLLVLFWSRRSGHIGHIERFDGDHTEAVDQLPCRLVVKIMTTVANALVDTGDDLMNPLWLAAG